MRRKPGSHRTLFAEGAAMMRVNPDPYLVLGVSPTATQAEITHAYRDRLRAHHPDTRHAPSSQIADEHLRQVLAAYALLRDPARRADFDRATTRAAKPPAHRRQGPHLLTVPRRAASRSPSPTAPPPQPQPRFQSHHCVPARCAGTDSCAIVQNDWRTTRITRPPHRGPHEHRYQQRTRSTNRDSGDPEKPAGQGYADRDHDQTTTRRSPYPNTGCRQP